MPADARDDETRRAVASDAAVAQWLGPIALIGWLAFSRDHSRLTWALRTTLAALYLLAVSLAGMWPFDPRVAFGILALVLFAGAACSFVRVRATPLAPVTLRGRLGAGALAALVLLAGTLAINVVRGRHPPRIPMIDLGFPLAGGTYYAVNGGSTEIINAHHMTLAGDRFRPWRGQSHGVDLVKLNRWGFRAGGLLPSDPARYAIFGDPVLSPCSGTVISAADGLRDLTPPRMDREHMPGNHVIVECMDAWIVIAHLREGSVCVTAGDTIAIGQQLGEVGNTGNSGEPHLHIHAQRPGTRDAPVGGEPLAIRFNGRYLVRNAVIRSTGAP